MISLKHLFKEAIESNSAVTSKITIDDEDGISFDIMADGRKVGEVDTETSDGVAYTITDAKIDTTERGKGYYYKALFNLLDQKPNIKIHSVYRSPEANKAWNRLMDKMGDKYSVVYKKVDGELMYILSKK